MWRLLLLLALLASTSCWRTEEKPLPIVHQMSLLKKGMSQEGVGELLGKPDRIENRYGHQVWFYLTSRSEENNFTPLIFKNGYLMDWGYYYYNVLQENGNASEGQGEEEDTLSWPPSKHRLILPPSRQKKETPKTPPPPQPVPQETPPEKPQLPSNCDHNSLWE